MLCLMALACAYLSAVSDHGELSGALWCYCREDTRFGKKETCQEGNFETKC